MSISSEGNGYLQVSFFRIFYPLFLVIISFFGIFCLSHSFSDYYVQESQFWKLYKEDPSSCAIVMKTSLGLVYLLACLLEPFMPSFSNEVSYLYNFIFLPPSSP